MRTLKLVGLAAVLTAGLSGCAVYTPGPPPGAVYVAPAPRVYAPPPVVYGPGYYGYYGHRGHRHWR